MFRTDLRDENKIEINETVFTWNIRVFLGFSRPSQCLNWLDNKHCETLLFCRFPLVQDFRWEDGFCTPLWKPIRINSRRGFLILGIKCQYLSSGLIQICGHRDEKYWDRVLNIVNIYRVNALRQVLTRDSNEGTLITSSSSKKKNVLNPRYAGSITPVSFILSQISCANYIFT